MHHRTDVTRRRLLLGTAAMLGAAPLLGLAGALSPTPRQTAGPFYPAELPLDDDNDLTQVAGQPGRAAGQISDLGGQVLDTSARPLPGLRVEIWQCDANGRSRHPLERGTAPIDPRFQGHGHSVTDADGRYRFRTIRPVPYPGRTPHIHAAVLLPGERPLITQIYVDGEARNAEDFLFRQVAAERRHLLVAAFVPADGADSELSARFDFVLGATPAQG